MICLICLKVGGKGDEMVATTCGHCYHKHCIEKWFEKSMLCPSCRTPSAARAASLIRLFIDFSDDTKLQDIDDLNEQIFLRETEVREFRKVFKTSETQVKALKRKLLKTDCIIETLKHQLQVERNLSNIYQTKLKEYKVKHKIYKVDNEMQTIMKHNVEPQPYQPLSQPHNTYQSSNAYQSLNAYKHPNQCQTLNYSINSYQPLNSDKPTSSYQPPNSCQFSNTYQPYSTYQPSYQSSNSNQLHISLQPSNAYQTSISFQPQPLNAESSLRSRNQCYKCTGKGYVENSSILPLFHSIAGVQHCSICMGKGVL